MSLHFEMEMRTCGAPGAPDCADRGTLVYQRALSDDYPGEVSIKGPHPGTMLQYDCLAQGATRRPGVDYMTAARSEDGRRVSRSDVDPSMEPSPAGAEGRSEGARDWPDKVGLTG